MQFGVVFPQTEIGTDPAVIRDYAQAAEDLGYSHVLVYDHVLGASSEHRPNWTGPYDHRTQFHEPFVLFGYLAGVTTHIQLVTGIVILPQRQTALVAKQAAEVDVLSGGRLRLGVGIGWNDVEYEALGEDFHTRGRRVEEQIEVMRALWTQEVVSFHGRWHHITDAGINPLPIQRPIPLWMGGGAEPVLRRVARLADGWFPQIRPDERGRETLQRLFDYASEAGRDPASIGIEGRVGISNGGPDDWARTVEAWQQMGATHLGVNTMSAGLDSPAKHIDAIRSFKEATDGLAVTA
ncbi:LLM class F420-dependent oxidoreductase [SAR202 cluster bacterium AC-647-N09_OGT_505m]|nr:LLM class F420-dependent oxidoreductase [SAR202 cluster bacterium AC-647-N09_OGT_505m]